MTAQISFRKHWDGMLTRHMFLFPPAGVEAGARLAPALCSLTSTRSLACIRSVTNPCIVCSDVRAGNVSVISILQYVASTVHLPNACTAVSWISHSALWGSHVSTLAIGKIAPTEQYVGAPSGTRLSVPSPSVRAVDDSVCFRPRGQCDRQCWLIPPGGVVPDVPTYVAGQVIWNLEWPRGRPGKLWDVSVTCTLTL
jgi:hypothetical protein